MIFKKGLKVKVEICAIFDDRSMLLNNYLSKSSDCCTSCQRTISEHERPNFLTAAYPPKISVLKKTLDCGGLFMKKTRGCCAFSVESTILKVAIESLMCGTYHLQYNYPAQRCNKT